MIASALIGSALFFNLTLLSPPELKRRVEPSVFLLQVELVGRKSSGTGFLISESGRVVTNNHVIDGAVRVVARNDAGQEFPMKPGFYVRDVEHDLAILQLDMDQVPPDFVPKPLYMAPMTDDLIAGMEVHVLGHPGGDKIAEFTTGKLSAIEPEPRRLRFDATIHRGSSGSPLFDARNGLVIGVVTSFWTGAAKLNYATPVEYLHTMQAKLSSSSPLIPYRTPASSPLGLGEGKSGLARNLAISLVFFLLVVFGLRSVLRAAGR